jgi:hypothetical protein
MKAPSFDELVLLPEPLALHRSFDAKNYRTFRWLSALVAFLSLGGIGASADHHDRFGIFLYIANALLGVAFFILRDREIFIRNFRQVLLVYLFAEIVVLKYATAYFQDSEHMPFIMVAFLLLAFRLRVAEHLMLFAAFWATAVFPLTWVGMKRALVPEDQDAIIAVSIMSLICLVTALALTQVERKRFLGVWRRESSRHRERLRMREEIDYARKIQLSMLPQAPPGVDWLDLAAASLPATEVGGDYYEYFQLSESQLVLVIGDVAGHGLASGLLLSGVRSCLYLLEAELASPSPVFERLNHMVRRTTDKRTYVTLLCAVLDRAAGKLELVSAGHPPMLHFDPRSRQFQEVGHGAPPLGTFLQSRYEPVCAPMAAGDLLVFYTDGLVEARNAQGQEYGDARLQKALARAADSRTAREVRDAVLGDLSNFKGDHEQEDDITLVVVRVR